MIANQHPHLDVGSASHPGEKREINEDRYIVASYRIQKDSTPVLLAIVADGIGGHQAGEVASEIAVEAMVETVMEEGVNDPTKTLRAAVLAAGTSVFGAAQQSSDFYGMGSTAVIACIVGKRLYTAHVGDSRIYLYRRQRLRLISKDHTWIQEAIEHKIIKPQEAADHPNAHMLQRAIGSSEPPEADFRMRLSDRENDSDSENNQGLLLNSGEKILLCTDGLTDLVKDEEIELALAEQSPDDAAQSLITLARARGGHDNITVVILAVPEKWLSPESSRRRRVFFFSAILILSFVVVIAVAMLLSWQLGWIPWPLESIGSPTQVESAAPLIDPTLEPEPEIENNSLWLAEQSVLTYHASPPPQSLNA